MNNKLLDKTLHSYVIYSLIVLIVSAPVFYYATKRIYTKEADDTLMLHKREFLFYSATNLKKTDIDVWNNFNRNIKIQTDKDLKKDSLFFSQYYDTLDAEMEPYRELNFPIEIDKEKYTYSERINLVESEDLLKNIGILFFVIIIILLLGLFFITKRLSQKMWKPFYDTLKKIESFEIDKPQTMNFSSSNVEEFSRLNSSIKNLTEKNISIYNNQKEFIENAAHELQTPLAVFQAKIDILLQRQDITEPQAVILGTLNENLAKLNRLNKNLLFLSGLDTSSYPSQETLSFPEFISKQIEFFSEQAAAKGITVQLKAEDSFEIMANPALTEIMLNNIFLNAIKHNIPSGKVNIAIRKNQIEVSNTARNSSLNKETLFKRFAKSNSSEEGTGLGLAIIKKIADLNSWDLNYHFQNNLHFFRVTFK